MKDLYSSYRETTVVQPKLVSNDVTGNGTGTDLLGFTGALMVAKIGAVGDLFNGSNYVTIRFLESSNNVVFSAISDDDLIGGNNTVLIDANNEANCIHQRAYTGSARYVTISFDVTGTMANGTPMEAHVVKGLPLHGPVT
jgi:hypothetical protein